MLTDFLLQYNIILLCLESLKEELVFNALSYILKRKQVAFLLFIESGQSICNLPQFGFILQHLEYNKNIIKDIITTFH